MSEFILENGEITLGSIRVRLAKNRQEIEQAQAIRYHIFYEEFNAKPSASIALAKRDFDHFDDYADHLIVFDADTIVGTYRLLRQDAAQKAGRFYTSDEFDISKLENNYSGLLEMGRSCVLPDYRSKAVLQLLWQGIAEYVAHHRVKFLFGCASFQGVNPQDHAEALSFLYHNNLAPELFRPRTLPDVYQKMNLIDPSKVNTKNVIRNLPPLIKGYLRIGGFVGDGAFIDHDFGTTDVCVVLSTDHLTSSYQKHYERKTGAEF